MDVYCEALQLGQHCVNYEENFGRLNAGLLERDSVHTPMTF